MKYISPAAPQRLPAILVALFLAMATLLKPCLGGVVNVDFNLGGTPTYSGLGAAPDEQGHTFWNGLALTGASARGTATATSSFDGLLYSDNTTSGLSLTIRRTTQADVAGGAQSGGHVGFNLLRDYALVNSGNPGIQLTGTIMIGGLTPGGICDLYLYGAGSQPSYRTEFTVNGQMLRTTGASAITDTFVEWEDYVRFTGMPPNQAGEIFISFANIIDGSNPSQVGPVNGLQLVLPNPALRIEQLGPEEMRLSWPTNAQGFLLEQTSDLPNPSWLTVTNTPLISSGEYNVTVEATVSQLFFRLRKP